MRRSRPTRPRTPATGWPGCRTAPIEFGTLVGDIGSNGLRVEVEGTARECDETNNVEAWNEEAYP